MDSWSVRDGNREGRVISQSRFTVHLHSVLSRNDAVGLGGTANLAVLGGNLPPSRTHGHRSPFSEIVVRTTVGLVARQNGPVARSTRRFNRIVGVRESRGIGHLDPRGSR